VKNRADKIGENNNRQYKKHMLMLHIAVIVLVITLIPPASASFLPAELGNWRLIAEHITDLATSGQEVSHSENMGKWTSASYVRSEPPAGIEVQLTEGAGPGGLYVPEGVISSDDGPIGFLSKYETLSVAGRRAILERSDVTGQALAVILAGRRTVTFEARGISREDLLGFAESMIEVLQHE